MFIQPWQYQWDHWCVPRGYWCNRCGQWVQGRCYHPAPVIDPIPVPYYGRGGAVAAADQARDLIHG